MAKITLRVDTNIGQSTKQIEALKGSFQNVAQSISGIKVNKDLTAQINSLTKHYKALADAAAKVIKVNNKNLIEEQKLIKAKAQSGKAIADEITAIEKSKTAHVKYGTAVDDSRRKQEKHEAQMKKSTAQTNKSTDANKKHTQSIASMIPNILKWQVAMTAVMLPLRKLQEALDSVNETLVETEKRVVSLRRVAGDAANANELYDLAQKYGQTFENVADVVENLVKSGYTWEESLKAAEPALLAINVAELDAAQATEGLIAVVKQYGLELEDLNYIQGVLNKTADNAAVTTEKLLIALQKTGSTAKNANIDFEETVGLITALSEGTAASGQNIGNALRSLIVFTSDSKALDTFAGLSSGMAETVKKFRSGQASILEVWEGLGGELAGMGSQKGTLEDLFGGAELTADIEAQLTQITDSFAEIYGTAGNYRQNYFIALLDNIEKVKDVTGELGDVTTYSQKENEKYLNTYEAKLNDLTAQWQKLANDEQGFLAFKKGLIDAGSGALDLLEALGGIDTVIKSISITGATLLLWFKPTIITGLISGLQSLIGIIPNAITAWKAYASGIVTANTAMSASIPVIGLLLVSITALTGAISAHKEAQHEANQEAIQNWESIKEQTASLDQLYKEYEKLTPEAKNYAEVEKELVTALGEKSVALEGLTKGTDDYREAVKRLAEEELRRAEQTYTLAQKAAAEELGSNVQGLSFVGSGTSPYIDRMEKIFGNAGVNYDVNTSGHTTFFNIAGMRKDRSIEGILHDYDLLNQVAQDIWIEYKNSLYKNDPEYTEQVLEVYNQLVSKIEEARPYVENYRNNKDSLNFVLERLQEIEGTTEETSSNVENFSDKLKTLDEETLTSIVDKLKAARDATRDSYEYEEKKKAVLEAEERLRQAKENLTVVQFDENGNWTRVANQKEILEAEEDLEQARKDIEKAAYDNIITELENGNKNSTSILMVIKHWAAAYGSGDFSHFEETVDSILKEYGIDLNKMKGSTPTTKGGVPAGVVPAGGVGAYLYGTSDPIVQKMLSGTNDNTAEVARQNGLLFGSSREVASVNPNSVTYHNQSVSNDRHDTQYHVNGVPIGADAASRYTINELFQVMDLV